MKLIIADLEYGFLSQLDKEEETDPTKGRCPVAGNPIGLDV